MTSPLPATGIIGTGHMGGAIARCLLCEGHKLAVHDIAPQATAELAGLGADVAPDAQALAAGCDVVLLSLPSHREVADVVLGDGGILPVMRPGTVLASLVTGSVLALPALTEACAARGIRYVTAPVSQGVRNAGPGRLTVFAAGTPDARSAAEPVLRAFARTIIWYGEDHRTAMAAKLVTNASWFIGAAALGELMALALRSGVSPGGFQAMMTASCGNTWVTENDVPSVLDGTFDPSFTLGLALKDLDLIAELAGETGVPLPVTALAAGLFSQAQAMDGPDAPELTPVRIALEEAGILSPAVASGA